MGEILYKNWVLGIFKEKLGMGILKMKKIGVEYPNLGEFCNFLGRFYTNGDLPKVGLLELSTPVLLNRRLAEEIRNWKQDGGL